MKRLFAILLLTLMLASLTLNAFAAEGKGTITVSNATIGETYYLYKIFSATLNTEKEPLAIAYTYDRTLMENPYFRQEGGYIYIQPAGQEDDTHLTPYAVAFLGGLIEDERADQEITATNNTVVFSNLDYGYYYISTSLNTLGLHAVSVDSTKPDTYIIDKNQGPTWYNPEGTGSTQQENWLGKHILVTNSDRTISRVKENSVNFGDTVTFEVAFNATNYYGTERVLTYFLNDTIADGFEIKKDTLKVFFDTDQKEINKDYFVRWSGETDHEKKFTIYAPWYTYKADGKVDSPKYSANTVFRVTYDATLLTDAVIAGDGNPNSAKFDYRKETSDTAYNPTQPDFPPPVDTQYHECTPETTVTYTYALGITKIDGTDSQRLSGAEFTLERVAADGSLPEIKAKESESGVYEYDTTATVKQFQTDNNGVLVIKGLAEGTYRLKEAKAPDGYNRSLTPKDYTFIRGASYARTHTMKNGSTDVTTTYPVDVKADLFVNQRGVILPITGGIGTTIFYILGGGLMFVAILLLITRKRMNNEK